ncbi:MAG: NAD(P)H-hydrate dehydratase [Cytophagaceae bacterium]|nr:NAD(P)H-hydrate dehydratase [Cytophagaceae bacterium]MBL0302824.1 NAD(P)H-hydrate dehydratase [Cytophagaceae bacterium]MBL0325651.1 NAD(P)H-hydrate dehydratase [Cytophagaceae bacterium]
MKVFSAAQIKAWDQYTIKNEPIASIDLMERASSSFTKRFCELYNSDFKVLIFAGPGNNGGDGLAIARMLHQNGYDIETVICGESENGTEDFKTNLKRAENQGIKIISAEDIEFKKSIEKRVIIDAIFGNGLNRKIEGIFAEIINKINESNIEVVAVDFPSGVFCDYLNTDDVKIKAKYTLTFQCPKPAFFMKENEEYLGEWEILDIGLHPDFEKKSETNFYFTLKEDFIERPRAKFSHKGTYGHALLIAGSHGMMGAAILASKACLRSGVGKVSISAGNKENDIIQIAIPEAIFLPNDLEKSISEIWTEKELEPFDAIGIGPGIGQKEERVIELEAILKTKKPLVIDADAINLLAKNRELLENVPANTIFTPHLKEFKNLTGENPENSFETFDLLRNFASENQWIIVLKGYHTAVALPDGSIHFNSSGNPGMATAGSGDVLTGVILAYLAQGFSPQEAAIKGVFDHGKAGDAAAQIRSYKSLIASDIIENLR